MRRRGRGSIGERSSANGTGSFAARIGWLPACLLLSNVALAQTETATEESADLRERLTEREDETRVENPFSVDFLGRPLYLSGEVELAFDFLGKHGDSEDDPERARLLMEPELEAELFYSVDEKLSLFAQLRVGMEQDLRDGRSERLSNRFVERGEMWLSLFDVAGSGLNVEVGRLDFEDDRTWWWDTDLDAVRVSHERDNFEWVISAAAELAPNRSDRDFIEAEHDGVRRLLFETAWDWAPEQSVQVFAVLHWDGSPAHAPGQQVRPEREDESDAQLTWLGLRASGAWSSSARGLFGYWLDIASVRGHERLTEYLDEPPNEPPDSDDEAHSSGFAEDTATFAGDTTQVSVNGWAIDMGATWVIPAALEPRLTVGFARGSGDRVRDDKDDRAFRQTGLHSNDIGFGGVQRFGRYGRLLQPELSNLSVETAGIGITLFESSSIDLIYHRYRLLESADSLRDASFDAELTGDRDIGQAFDLVLALEEWRRFELEFAASAFQAGRAFGEDEGDWLLGGFLSLRVAF